MPKDSYLHGLKADRAKRADMLAAVKGRPACAGVSQGARDARIRDLEQQIAILDANLNQAIALAERRQAPAAWRLRLGRFRLAPASRLPR
jgi:hypothetical protein